MKHTLKFFSSILFPLFLAGSEWLPVPEQDIDTLFGITIIKFVIS